MKKRRLQRQTICKRSGAVMHSILGALLLTTSLYSHANIVAVKAPTAEQTAV